MYFNMLCFTSLYTPYNGFISIILCHIYIHKSYVCVCVCAFVCVAMFVSYCSFHYLLVGCFIGGFFFVVLIFNFVKKYFCLASIFAIT